MSHLSNDYDIQFPIIHLKTRWIGEQHRAAYHQHGSDGKQQGSG